MFGEYNIIPKFTPEQKTNTMNLQLGELQQVIYGCQPNRDSSDHFHFENAEIVVIHHEDDSFGNYTIKVLTEEGEITDFDEYELIIEMSKYFT